MNIGIDARLINETGVGRYIRNLIRELSREDQTNTYIVFLKKNEYASFTCPNHRWKKIVADVPWHSLSEQLILPWIYLRERLDLLHIPYFNIPIFYPGRMVVTIHDLTILHFNTGKATTLPWMLYALRRIGYRIVLAVGFRRVKAIIAVSKTTKQEIIDHFHTDPEKIVVTHEGVDNKFHPASWRIKFQIKNRIIKEPYFLYVGNAYPHKNLETLLAAFQLLITRHSPPITLVFVGKDDFFYRKIKQLVVSLGLTGKVRFFGEANDEELINLYMHAVAFVFPSLMEGFGLPALEALSMGCPVIVSDIPVFHELLGDYAQYVPPYAPEDLCEALANACAGAHTIRERDVKSLLDSYSWSTLAADTIGVYLKA